MEILEAIGFIALGFVPTLAALEIAGRIKTRWARRPAPRVTEIGLGGIELLRASKSRGPRIVPVGIGVESLYAGGPELLGERAELGADFEGFAPLPELQL